MTTTKSRPQKRPRRSPKGHAVELVSNRLLAPPGSFRITRKLTPKECHWLSKPIEKGTVMYAYTGCTYGCCSSSGTALTLDPKGGTPFTEIPNDAFCANK